VAKRPFINVEDKVDRFVGRRTKTPDTLSIETSRRADDRPPDSHELESREPTLGDLRELQPGELQQYTVIRVADEILVDLMTTAGGIDYAAAAEDVVVHDVDGVPIPFASPSLLWRMKVVTHREKDAGDLVFLRYWFTERGETPPE
jgi:hypothetical protein